MYYKNKEVRIMTSAFNPANEIIKISKIFGFNKQNICGSKRQEFKIFIKEYFSQNKEFLSNKSNILLETITKI